MSHQVIEHHHDPEEGVYRIIVGVPVYTEQVALDEDGKPKLVAEPEVDEAPVHETEQVLVGYHDVQDFVFDHEDEAWQGKSPKQIARAQRDRVREALERQHTERVEQARKAQQRRELPGVGEAL